MIQGHGRECVDVGVKVSALAMLLIFETFVTEVPPTGSANFFTIEFGYNEVGWMKNGQFQPVGWGRPSRLVLMCFFGGSICIQRCIQCIQTDKNLYLRDHKSCLVYIYIHILYMNA